ncbi:T9SS C-terminal target domain-containing protein [Haliscomenobacter hydrossis]|uniref:PKD domain containing protein n=1 Tax=Haliscomenobacter hydrossis (strain ATCC 27775 / DSM 1100 / LMG 10767 / O) TaxID=760192 RepID=F4KQB0_HALH1|nr:T9SS C-terminal target domain-containing protein [Haliscomenobacter hydrossis]AEE48936.1 hypothetical protein Halhy_1037 [Haliscomenobacter hydrossis DSM 1100]
MSKKNALNITYTKLILCLISIGYSNVVDAQKILNTIGAHRRINDYNLSYSVGEIAIKTLQGNTGYVTQGVLQPIFALTPSGPLVTLPLPRAVCLGESIEVAFSTVLSFNDDNEFILELSDQAGTFEKPTVIGKVRSKSVRRIPINIPLDLDPTKAYSMRVKSSSPAVEGRVTNLLVRIKPKASFSIDKLVCTEDTIVANFTGKDTISSSNYRWYFTDGSLQKAQVKYQQGISWSIPGEKKISLVVDNNGCLSDPVEQTIKAERRLSKPNITCGRVTGNSIAFNWSQVGGSNIRYKVITSAPYTDTLRTTFSLRYLNLAPQTKVQIKVEAYGEGACGFNVDTQTCVTLTCPKFTARLAKDRSNICAGQTETVELELSGSKLPGAYEVVYSANGGKYDTTEVQANAGLLISPEMNTTYNIIAVGNTSYEGCYTQFDNLRYQIGVASNNNPGQAEAPQLICDNQDGQIILPDLLKGEDNNGKWSVSPEIKEDAFDPDAGTFAPKGVKPDTYFFKYTVPRKTPSCTERSSIVQINLERKLAVEINDYSSCLDANGKTTINLKTVAQRTNRAAPHLVRWYYDATLKDTIKQEQIEIAAPLTLYAFVGQGKCASAPTAVTLKPGEILPTPKIEGPSSVKTGERILLSTSSSFPPGSLFIWKTPDTIAAGTDLYNYPVRLATKHSEGRYSLQVRGPQQTGRPSCESPFGWLDILVFKPEDPILKIGNAASATTPWQIEGIDQYPQHKITVVNRLGRVVFQVSGTYSNNWYGTFDGKPLPQATYYYQIETGDPDKKPILGAIYLIY